MPPSVVQPLEQLAGRLSSSQAVAAERRGARAPAALASTTATPFNGVRADRKRFRARWRVSGGELHLGMHDTAEEAARAFDAWAASTGRRELLNFPAEHPPSDELVTNKRLKVAEPAALARDQAAHQLLSLAAEPRDDVRADDACKFDSPGHNVRLDVDSVETPYGKPHTLRSGLPEPPKSEAVLTSPADDPADLARRIAGRGMMRRHRAKATADVARLTAAPDAQSTPSPCTLMPGVHQEGHSFSMPRFVSPAGKPRDFALPGTLIDGTLDEEDRRIEAELLDEIADGDALYWRAADGSVELIEAEVVFLTTCDICAREVAADEPCTQCLTCIDFDICAQCIAAGAAASHAGHVLVARESTQPASSAAAHQPERSSEPLPPRVVWTPESDLALIDAVSNEGTNWDWVGASMNTPATLCSVRFSKLCERCSVQPEREQSAPVHPSQFWQSLRRLADEHRPEASARSMLPPSQAEIDVLAELDFDEDDSSFATFRPGNSTWASVARLAHRLRMLDSDATAASQPATARAGVIGDRRRPREAMLTSSRAHPKPKHSKRTV
jgi:hypothetical protein